MKKATYLVLVVLIILGAQLFSLPPSEGATLERKEVVVSFSVWIEVDGKATALMAIKGIGDESEVVEQRSAGDTSVHKLPGRIKVSDIVIKKYVSPLASDPLYQWRRSVVGGGMTEGKLTSFRKNGAIVFFDASSKEVARYNFYNAWPSQWKGITLDGQSPFAEEIVLTVDRIERVR